MPHIPHQKTFYSTTVLNSSDCSQCQALSAFLSFTCSASARFLRYLLHLTSHCSSFRFRSTITLKYSIRYIQQKVRPKRLGCPSGWRGLGFCGFRAPELIRNCRTLMLRTCPGAPRCLNSPSVTSNLLSFLALHSIL